MMPNQTTKLTLVRGEKLKELTRLTPWKSIFTIGFEWLLIIGLIFTHLYFSNPFVYIIVAILIATRLYALYSLIHDAIHYLIVRNKFLNDFIAQVFLGFPLFISLKQMRKAHLAHHKHLQTERDPEMQHLNYSEFQFPKSKTKLFQLFLLDLSGVNFIYYQALRIKKLILNFKPSEIKRDKFVLFLLYTSIFIVAYYLGFAKEILLYWIIPYATVYQVLNRLRLSTEHFNVDSNFAYSTRSVVPSFIEQWTLTPYNLGYHLEHHLYPGVPFYNLSSLHKALMAFPSYKSQVLIEKSYIDVIKKCIR